jgi:hypothetical protein
MSMRPKSLRAELISRLLDNYERSALYGRPAPWPRDVIVRLDPKSFPEAFAPDGRELRNSLMFVASELESAGCVRVVRHAVGPLRDEPAQVRIGPDQVDRTYREAMQVGYEPLAKGLNEVGGTAASLATGKTPLWMRTFLEEVTAGLREANPSKLGMSRERFKRDWHDVLCAARAATLLAEGMAPTWERIVSERLFKDSKLLGRIRPYVISILVRADPRWQGIPPEEAGELLEAYGVRRKPGLIRCAGAATLSVGCRMYALEDFSPAAHLPDSWAEAWVNGVAASGVRMVTTVENEYPFLSYLEEAGGPPSLGRLGELVIYTGGFPSPNLTAALARLAALRSDIRYRHWGDADVGGLRIWWFLRTRLSREVDLFRTTADWVEAEAARGGCPLSSSERKALQVLRRELGSSSAGDTLAARKLIDALLTLGIKLEQECY